MAEIIKDYTYDPKADAIYITLSNNPVKYTRSLDDTRIIDFDADDNPVGIELLCISRGVITDDLPNMNEIIRLLEDKHVKTFA